MTPTLTFHFLLIELKILTKKDVRNHIRNVLFKYLTIKEKTPQKEKLSRDKLVDAFCEFYKLPDAKKRKQIKPNKRKVIFERSMGICEAVDCENLIGEENDIHHRVSEDLGGSRKLDNLFMLCANCHDKISKFQRKTQVEVCELMFKQIPELHIYDFEREDKIISKVNKLQEDFFDKYKFKPLMN